MDGVARTVSVTSAVLVESYLEKKGPLAMNKRYLCRLREGKLNYYVAKDDKSHMETGSIDISQVQSIRPGKGMTFEIVTHSKTHTFTAPDFATRDKWVSGVQEAMMISSRKLSSSRQSTLTSQNQGSFDEPSEDLARQESVFDETPTKQTPQPSPRKPLPTSPKPFSPSTAPKSSTPKPWSPFFASPKPVTSPAPNTSENAASPKPKPKHANDSPSFVYEEVSDFKRAPVVSTGVISPGVASPTSPGQSTLYEEISRSTDADSPSGMPALYADASSLKEIVKKAPPTKTALPIRPPAAPKAPPPVAPDKREDLIPPAAEAFDSSLASYEEVLLEPPLLFHDNPESTLTESNDRKETKDKDNKDDEDEVEEGYSTFTTIQEYQTDQNEEDQTDGALREEMTPNSDVNNGHAGEMTRAERVLSTTSQLEPSPNASGNNHHYSTASPVRLSALPTKEEKLMPVKAEENTTQLVLEKEEKVAQPLPQTPASPVPVPRPTRPVPPRPDLVTPPSPKPLSPKPLSPKPKPVVSSTQVQSAKPSSPATVETVDNVTPLSPPSHQNSAVLGQRQPLANQKATIVIPPLPNHVPPPPIIQSKAQANLSSIPKSTRPPSQSQHEPPQNPAATQETTEKSELVPSTRTNGDSGCPPIRSVDPANPSIPLAEPPSQATKPTGVAKALLRNATLSLVIDDTALDPLRQLDLVLDAETRRSPIYDLPNPPLETKWQSAFDEIRAFLAENGCPGGERSGLPGAGGPRKQGEAIAALRRYLNGEGIGHGVVTRES